MRGFSHTPRTHSLAHAGANPDLPVFAAFESPRVHVVATPEERSEKGDLLLWRRCLIDRFREQVHEVDGVRSAAMTLPSASSSVPTFESSLRPASGGGVGGLGWVRRLSGEQAILCGGERDDRPLLVLKPTFGGRLEGVHGDA